MLVQGTSFIPVNFDNQVRNLRTNNVLEEIRFWLGEYILIRFHWTLCHNLVHDYEIVLPLTHTSTLLSL